MRKWFFVVLYVLMMVCFLSWMVFSNQMLLGMSGGQPIERAQLDEYRAAKGSVHYGIDNVQSLGDLMETVTIRGWAYVETDYDNADCKTEILLVNDRSCYRLNFEVPEDKFTYLAYVLRTDVVKAYPNQRIYSENIGYISDFSSFMMESGVYDVYIYRYENEYDSGLARTKYQIVKDGAELTMRDWIAKEITIETSAIVDTYTVNSSLDDITLTDGVLNLEGWIFAEEKDAHGQKVYLGLQSESLDIVCSTISTSRPDVSEAYKDERYEKCGFSSSIQLNENIIPDDLTVTILVEIDGQFYRGNAYNLQCDEDGIKKTMRAKMSNKVSVDTSAIVKEKAANSNLEVATMSNGVLNILGWSFVEEKAANKQQVYLQVQNGLSNACYSTIPVSRPDVAESYQDERYEMSGFSSRIQLDEETMPDELTVAILVEAGGQIYSGRTYDLQFSEDGVTITVRE